MTDNSNFTKRLIALVLVFGCVLAGLFIYNFTRRIGKVEIPFYIAPSDSKVVAKNEKGEIFTLGNGNQYLPEGKYQVTVSRDHFDTGTSDLDVRKDNHNIYFTQSLSYSDELGQQYSSVHASEFSEIEGKTYEHHEAEVTSAFKDEKFKIMDLLPYQDPYYTIGYEGDDEKSFILTVTTDSPRYRYIAMEKLRELGYDPADFTIKFENYKNPLGGNNE